MKPFFAFLDQSVGLLAPMLLLGCANVGSQRALPPTEVTMRQEMLGRWYKTQAYVRGEKRPPEQPAIEYRADGTCSYFLAGPQDNSNLHPSLSGEAWPGHWRLEGNKLYRNWAANWHYFAGHGPGNGQITRLTSEEMELKTEPFGAVEHYYRHPHWQEIEPMELHPERRDPWE